MLGVARNGRSADWPSPAMWSLDHPEPVQRMELTHLPCWTTDSHTSEQCPRLEALLHRQIPKARVEFVVDEVLRFLSDL